MITYYIIGLVMFLLDLILLYKLRYKNEKVLKKWMILVTILAEWIPLFNASDSIVGLIVIILTLLIEEDFKLSINSKLTKWLNETV